MQISLYDNVSLQHHMYNHGRGNNPKFLSVVQFLHVYCVQQYITPSPLKTQCNPSYQPEFIKWILCRFLHLCGKKCFICVYLINTKWLTWGEASSKEHVKEIFRCNIRLKASVEIKSSMSIVTWAVGTLSSTYIILPLLVWVTEHCISISNLCRRTKTAFIVLYFMYINFLKCIGYGDSETDLLLKASVAPGTWFLSGWNFKASFL